MFDLQSTSGVRQPRRSGRRKSQFFQKNEYTMTLRKVHHIKSSKISFSKVLEISRENIKRKKNPEEHQKYVLLRGLHNAILFIKK